MADTETNDANDANDAKVETKTVEFDVDTASNSATDDEKQSLGSIETPSISNVVSPIFPASPTKNNSNNNNSNNKSRHMKQQSTMHALATGQLNIGGFGLTLLSEESLKLDIKKRFPNTYSYILDNEKGSIKVLRKYKMLVNQFIECNFKVIYDVDDKNSRKRAILDGLNKTDEIKDQKLLKIREILAKKMFREHLNAFSEWPKVGNEQSKTISIHCNGDYKAISVNKNVYRVIWECMGDIKMTDKHPNSRKFITEFDCSGMELDIVYINVNKLKLMEKSGNLDGNHCFEQLIDANNPNISQKLNDIVTKGVDMLHNSDNDEEDTDSDSDSDSDNDNKNQFEKDEKEKKKKFKELIKQIQVTGLKKDMKEITKEIEEIELKDDDFFDKVENVEKKVMFIAC